MSLGEAIAPFIGRVILAWYFLSEAYARAISWDGTVSLLALQDVPAPALLHFLALTVMVLGSFALLRCCSASGPALVRWVCSPSSSPRMS